jgi:hypothetical protein
MTTTTRTQEPSKRKRLLVSCSSNSTMIKDGIDFQVGTSFITISGIFFTGERGSYYNNNNYPLRINFKRGTCSSYYSKKTHYHSCFFGWVFKGYSNGNSCNKWEDNDQIKEGKTVITRKKFKWLCFQRSLNGSSHNYYFAN